MATQAERVTFIDDSKARTADQEKRKESSYLKSSNKPQRTMRPVSNSKYSVNKTPSLSSRRENLTVDIDGITLNSARDPVDCSSSTETSPRGECFLFLSLEEIVANVSNKKENHLELLATYRSFTSPILLLKTLTHFEPLTANLKLGNLYILTEWVLKFSDDFVSSWTVLHAPLQSFCAEVLQAHPEFSSEISSIKRQLAKISPEKSKHENFNAEGDFDITQFAATLDKDKLQSNEATQQLLFDNMDLLEVAQQMTLVEHKIFRKILPQEFVGQGWTKKDRADRSPHIFALTNHFNLISSWVQTEILSVPNVKHASRVVGRFLDLCEHLMELNNLNGVLEIFSSLNAAAIGRLKKVFSLLSNRHSACFKRVSEFVSSKDNHGQIRGRLSSTRGPAIPFLGLHLSDYIYIDEGNGNSIDINNKINFTKLLLLAKPILEIRKFQEMTYLFEPKPSIQEYIRKPPTIFDETQAFEVSRYLEPREGQQPEIPEILKKILQERGIPLSGSKSKIKDLIEEEMEGEGFLKLRKISEISSGSQNSDSASSTSFTRSRRSKSVPLLVQRLVGNVKESWSPSDGGKNSSDSSKNDEHASSNSINGSQTVDQSDVGFDGAEFPEFAVSDIYQRVRLDSHSSAIYATPRTSLTTSSTMSSPTISLTIPPTISSANSSTISSARSSTSSITSPTTTTPLSLNKKQKQAKNFGFDEMGSSSLLSMSSPALHTPGRNSKNRTSGSSYSINPNLDQSQNSARQLSNSSSPTQSSESTPPRSNLSSEIGIPKALTTNSVPTSSPAHTDEAQESFQNSSPFSDRLIRYSSQPSRVRIRRRVVALPSGNELRSIFSPPTEDDRMSHISKEDSGIPRSGDEDFPLDERLKIEEAESAENDYTKCDSDDKENSVQMGNRNTSKVTKNVLRLIKHNPLRHLKKGKISGDLEKDENDDVTQYSPHTSREFRPFKKSSQNSSSSSDL